MTLNHHHQIQRFAKQNACLLSCEIRSLIALCSMHMPSVKYASVRIRLFIDRISLVFIFFCFIFDVFYEMDQF